MQGKRITVHVWAVESELKIKSVKPCPLPDWVFIGAGDIVKIFCLASCIFGLHKNEWHFRATVSSFCRCALTQVPMSCSRKQHRIRSDFRCDNGRELAHCFGRNQKGAKKKASASWEAELVKSYLGDRWQGAAMLQKGQAELSAPHRQVNMSTAPWPATTLQSMHDKVTLTPSPSAPRFHVDEDCLDSEGRSHASFVLCFGINSVRQHAPRASSLCQGCHGLPVSSTLDVRGKTLFLTPRFFPQDANPRAFIPSPTTHVRICRGTSTSFYCQLMHLPHCFVFLSTQQEHFAEIMKSLFA